MRRTIQKVLLFIPPAHTLKGRDDINPVPPLGLAYLAAVLEKYAIEVRIVDCLLEGWERRVDLEKDVVRIGLATGEIEEEIRRFRPDVVGVNCLFTTQRRHAHEIFGLAKRVDKAIVTVAGGAHATVLPEMLLADQCVDYVVLGEGEYSFVDLIRAIEGRKEFSSLDGIAFRENGALRLLRKTGYIEKLDEIPFPARHLLNMDKYFTLPASHGRRKRTRFSPIITSRGCPAGCTFCSAHMVWGKRYRCRSAENVVEEMKLLKEQYAIEELMFEDDNLTMNPKRAEKLFSLMVEERLDFAWDTPNGVAAYALTENLLEKMKDSGCYRLNLAVETGNQVVMDTIIKKPLKLDRVRSLIRHASRIGLDVGMFLVIGMPGETEEQIRDSFRFAREVGVYNPHVSVATPYPGSELYETCVERGYLGKDFSLDNLHIRAFSLSTDHWDGRRLRGLYTRGKRSLAFAFLIDHPARFLKEIVVDRVLSDPFRALKKIREYI